MKKSASQCREQARREYYGTVFEVKKEIPAKHSGKMEIPHSHH
jgi:hypothetical protein